MKQHFFSLLLILPSCACTVAGCSAQVAPGDPEMPRKTSYTSAEIEALKADGVSDHELRSMGIKVRK
ncbi:MraY-like glycosyltransferase [Rosistilla carotiformis]|uniref:MraY-like glycosyltransferase n=1 Tax=Rosistilla carotiformis TaxID=2528017 RepID=A0A518JPG4_9BACT|nr:MraY-like glycosyltransferase [Rosistilla carotiformis]